MAKTTPAHIAAAKETAVQTFLPTTAPAAEFAALTASTSHKQNIVGVGIGRKVKKGKATSTIAIRFYVERKVPKNAMPEADVLPTSIEGVPTDIIETGRFFAQQTAPIARTRLRPTKGGCSVGFQAKGFVMAGTLGCLVTDGKETFILSNNHVLANENELPLKSPIFQPGLLDGGKVPKDRVASLSKFIEILPLPDDNHVDTAIAALDKKALGSPLILPKVGKLSSSKTIAAKEKLRVHKHGRTTGYTQGRITDVAADVNVGYDFGVARFVDQMLIVGDDGPFSDAGDSGSLIVDLDSNRATGLLFAGSKSHTIANHIDEVLTALGVTLLI